jgi:hypothetical protein
MPNAAIIATTGAATTVVRRPNGGVSIRQGGHHVVLSDTELRRLTDFGQARQRP